MPYYDFLLISSSLFASSIVRSIEKEKISRAYGAELAVRKRLREDSSIQQSEQIPFGAGLGLKVPEDPSARIPLEH